MPESADTASLFEVDGYGEGWRPMRTSRPHAPIWWRGPTKTTGILPKRELDEMANADCRFIDEDL